MPSATPRAAISRIEARWLAAVLVIFVGVNLASLKYMLTLASAHAATTRTDIQQIDLTATSWAYDMSGRQVEAGRPVRFSGRSSDTMHGFAVYHPDGRMLFTPGEADIADLHDRGAGPVRSGRGRSITAMGDAR